MEYTWRTPLKKYIEEHYIQKPQEWFGLNLSTAGTLDLTIVSDRFTGLSFPERNEQIWDMLRRLDAPTATGFLSLFTLDEANTTRLSRPPAGEERAVYSWLDLAERAVNAEGPPKVPQRKPRIPRTIVFYSFKGGVGRTTALTHVAWILAMRGRKVVAVDLDLEAPSLSSAFNLTSLPKNGIVDYFYERSYMPADIEPTILVTELFSEVRIPDASGRLFVVPAGTLDLDYIAKVDDLRAAATTENGEDLWATFYREINEQLQPDIILVDSRTGINEWGAFSLLRAADKVIIFLYPNEQNQQGIDVLIEALSGQVATQFVFSPVPLLGSVGREMVKKYWDMLKIDGSASNGAKEPRTERGEPITIPYLTEIALADHYPVQALFSYYTPIADIADEDTIAIRLSEVLADTQRRREILESLKFPEVDARTDANFDQHFQRTTDFDKLLDNNICLIRGGKGTGKSTLYWLLLKHQKSIRKLLHGRLDRVTCISGHGPFRPGPSRDDFQRIDQEITQQRGSWEAFWRGYFLLRLYMEDRLQQLLTASKFQSIQFINQVPREAERWGPKHRDALIKIAINVELDKLVKDLLVEMEKLEIQQRRDTLWCIYDDLDKDLKGELRERVLIGLFRFVEFPYQRGGRPPKLKVFLREDIWSLLNFDHKSYFNGRDLLLQWTMIDFLRLTLRKMFQSELFKDLVDRFSPIENIDQANEETMISALQLLWGNRWRPGELSFSVAEEVYGHLIDGSRTTFPQSTFPRTITVFLREATKFELQASQEQLPPQDRLLRMESIQAGLVATSQERCNEIREEYPELRPLLDFLMEKDEKIPTEDLRRVWREKMHSMLPEVKGFDEFIAYLESIGIIEEIGGSAKDKAYYISSIYFYGLKIKNPN